MPEYDLKWNITSCHSNFAEAYGTTSNCTTLSATSAGSGPHAGRGNAAVAKPACIGMTSTHTHVICAPEAIMRPTTGSRERRGNHEIPL